MQNLIFLVWKRKPCLSHSFPANVYQLKINFRIILLHPPLSAKTNQQKKQRVWWSCDTSDLRKPTKHIAWTPSVINISKWSVIELFVILVVDVDRGEVDLHMNISKWSVIELFVVLVVDVDWGEVDLHKHGSRTSVVIRVCFSYDNS